MPNKMLIDATHPEETRVVVVRGNRVEEFDFETAQRKQLRGNIYLAKVTRVEPSLQAAFIEYGGNRHGFLAFSEIHPDYYQIPVADRQALIEDDERAHREAQEEHESGQGRRRSRHRNSRRRNQGERVQSAPIDADVQQGAVDQQAAVAAGIADSEGAPQDTAHSEAQDLAQTQLHAGDHEPAAQADPSSDQASNPDHVAEPEPGSADGTVQFGETAEAAATSDEVPAAQAGAQDSAENGSDGNVAHDHGAADAAPNPASDEHEHDEDDEEEDDEEEEEVESVGGDDALEEVPERSFRPRRREYKIQEVIKRRQVMLVQVVKEERGSKGAALTTYLSLAGRYAVLMPNTARGGGISRKITSAQDRSRLKEVVQELDVPQGMGIILRTAGASRSMPEIKRDFEYLLRMWETVRDTTLKSQAPTLVYEEGSLIKRSLRDLYTKEIDDIMVAGDDGYREARDFMKMLMPANAGAVKLYRDTQPLFARMGVESQLDAMFQPVVQLKSGGYIVLNQTEALVSIDVNSGRSTREHHIEDTALKTNLEAAEEVARQLRLRDLAGLIVIDFIDMDEKRNNRAVERKIAECLRHDRARIQVGRISHFGLLEMSRQRIRASVLENSTESCPHCGGTGHVRSVSSVALQLVRAVEEMLMKGATHNLTVRTRTDVALYVLNHKRAHLRDLEDGFEVAITVVADASLHGTPAFVIERGEQVHTPDEAKTIFSSRVAAAPLADDEELETAEPFEAEAEVETEETEGLAEEARTDGENGDRPRRKRRRRRGGRGEGREPREDGAVDQVASSDADADAVSEEPETEDDDAPEPTEAREGEDGERRPRRRGRRGGRRRRNGQEGGHEAGHDAAHEHAADADNAAAEPSNEDAPHSDEQPTFTPAQEGALIEADPNRYWTGSDRSPAQVGDDQPSEAQRLDEPAVPAADLETEADAAGKPARRRSTVREKVSFGSPAAAPAAATPPPAAEPVQAQPEAAPETSNPAIPGTVPDAAAAAPVEPNTPRRVGWWSRRFGGG
jgi:ribonuclease E